MSIRSINPYIMNLFPKTESSSFWFINKKSNINIMNDTLTFVNKMRNIAYGVCVEQNSRLDHQKYITPNNPEVKRLAREIIHNSYYSDDGKMYAIEQWVATNIKYVSDVENYGKLERWAYPFETIKRRSGDCEDQAYLVHSLGLAAGVDPNRLRTYGGLVFDPRSTSPGGHAWNVYRREMDNKWVAIDTTYYATNIHFNERIPISKDLRYIDDFWYIEKSKTVSTPYSNPIRYSKGVLLDIKI